MSQIKDFYKKISLELFDLKNSIRQVLKFIFTIRNEKELKKFTINYVGTGTIIKAISPSPGTYLPENSSIKILLGN